MAKNGIPAAFYDLEGTLVSTNLVHTLAFYSTRQQGLWQTAKASVSTLAKLPFFGVTNLYSELRGLVGGPPSVFLGRAFRRGAETGDLSRHTGPDRPREKERPAAGGADRSARFHHRPADGSSRDRPLGRESA